MFKVIHKVRMFAADLGNIKDNTTHVNRLFLYAAIEELYVLRDFASHDYCYYLKYNQCIVMHLFNTSLPCSVYEKVSISGTLGHDLLKLNRNNSSLVKHKTGIDHLEMAVGSICSHLQLPATGACNHWRGTGGGMGVSFGAGVDKIK
jgi:hypothetical protein